MLSVFAQKLTMAGWKYIKLPFYGSTNPEEFLDWKDQMEYELEMQDFLKAKKVSRAVLEFEDYAWDAVIIGSAC